MNLLCLFLLCIVAISRPILEEKTPDSASEMLKEWEKRRQEAIHV